MRISVVVPCYNAETFIGAMLASLRRQTFEDWECIVVDDGSTDSSALVVEGLAVDDCRISLIRKSNGGPSSARNVGFSASFPSSEFITFMDADDVYLPEALGVLQASASRRGVIGAHGLGEFIDSAGEPLDPGAWPAAGRARLVPATSFRQRIARFDEATCFAGLVNGNVLFPPGLVLARREAYAAAGPFDESITGGEDWDMLIRLSRLGDFAFINDVVLGYRRHNSNFGARGPTIAEQAWQVRCKAFYSPENSVEQQRIAKVGWRALQAETFRERVRQSWYDARAGRTGPALRAVAASSVTAWRMVRGYPRPRISSERLRWPHGDVHP